MEQKNLFFFCIDELVDQQIRMGWPGYQGENILNIRLNAPVIFIIFQGGVSIKEP